MDKESIIDKVKGSGLVPMPVYGHTWDMMQYVLDCGVPGDAVECGVFSGAQVAIMAHCILENAQAGQRLVHLFDSFAGIPEAGPNDDQQPGIGPVPEEARKGRLVSSGVAVCSADSVRRNMNAWGVRPKQVQFHEGWFQDTVPTWGSSPISLLRLDGDLYESTLVCLKYLYPCLSEGGILIVDDYTLSGCFKAVLDYFDKQPPRFVEVPDGDGCAWAIKRTKS